MDSEHLTIFPLVASSFLRWVVPRRSNKTASLWKQGEQGTETCQKDGVK